MIPYEGKRSDISMNSGWESVEEMTYPVDDSFCVRQVRDCIDTLCVFVLEDSLSTVQTKT